VNHTAVIWVPSRWRSPPLETAVRATHPFDSNRHPDTHTSKASGVVTLPPTDALLGGAAGFVGGGQV